MAVRLVGFLLALCTLTTASPFIGPFSNIIEESSDKIHLTCSLISNYVQLFPLNSPQIEEVFFELRTPCKRTQYAVSKAKQLRNSPEFVINQKTVILVNGWNSNMNEAHTERLTKAYHCRGGYNLIVINTSDFLKSDYINSAHNTEKLGLYVAAGIKNLNIPGKNIHLIGHSLGAHVMGIAGRHFASETGDKIGRITGFDPARPCFIKPLVFSRLSVSDATFVDIIHTNPTEAGTEEAIGHADFYPGGLKPTQAGCLSIDFSCSHAMCVDYYTESIYPGNEHNFMGTECAGIKNLSNRKCTGTKAPMGFAASKQSKGIYFLEVNSNAPYGKNAKNDKYLKLDKCGACNK